jgi:uncharacterized membrane protein
MGRRMTVATVALIGVFVATYLTLYKMGMIGTLACGVGHCETVNASRWATFLGLPVAAWGVGFYLFLFALAFASTTERFADEPWMPLALVALTGWGVVFSGWLTWLELFVIHAICQWCVVSAVLVTLAFLVSLWDWRARRAAR